jgi:hypothetical protein
VNGENYVKELYNLSLTPSELLKSERRRGVGLLNQQMKEILKWNTPLISCAVQV